MQTAYPDDLRSNVNRYSNPSDLLGGNRLKACLGQADPLSVRFVDYLTYLLRIKNGSFRPLYCLTNSE